MGARALANFANASTAPPSTRRQANGPFADVDALTEVRGIGDGILESIRDLIEAR